MRSRFIQATQATGLLFSLSLSLISPLLLSTTVLAQPQTPPDSAVTKNKDKIGKTRIVKTSADKTSADKTPADPRRPLAVNEDPSMIGKRNINKGFDGWVGGSQAKEIAIGRQYSAQIDKELKLLDDPLVTEYINRVGQNIVNHSDAKLPFTIKVVDSDEVNAFAIPGGFLYVNKGVILAADNESELAGVMAHETGHVCARHAVEQNGKDQLMSYGILGAILATGGIAGTVLYNTQGLLQGLIDLKYSRGHEEEADRLGLQYMYAAGYDPNGMSTMFEKLEAMHKSKPGKGFSKLLMTHPESLERRDSALALAARFPEKEEYIVDTSEFERVKAHLFKLTNAKAAINGDIDDSSETGRPTLKHRQPGSDDSTATPTTNTPDDKQDEQKERPQLKRRTIEPQPGPSPVPSPNR